MHARPTTFNAFMAELATEAHLDFEQRAALVRVVERHVGKRLSVTSLMDRAEERAAVATLNLSAGYSRADTAAVVMARCGCGRSAAYAAIRTALARRCPPAPSFAEVGTEPRHARHVDQCHAMRA